MRCSPNLGSNISTYSICKEQSNNKDNNVSHHDRVDESDEMVGFVSSTFVFAGFSERSVPFPPKSEF
jgi:hypothetical protein